jgi:hypothetical protein
MAVCLRQVRAALNPSRLPVIPVRPAGEGGAAVAVAVHGEDVGVATACG